MKTESYRLIAQKLTANPGFLIVALIQADLELTGLFLFGVAEYGGVEK